MSTKYAFTDQFERLTPGTTNAWAFDRIPEGSTVLEIGSSIGYLTKHLHVEKRCQIDIVEIDEEAGLNAAKYARTALLGKQGNLDENCLLSLNQRKQYDFVVILDVLEHLCFPERVLEQVKLFMKPGGKLLLSVPNIAHNSVLINLFNNRFEYTSLGLLDSTHIHFFTYRSLCEMLRLCGYGIKKTDCIYKKVGENEISNAYEDLPRSIRDAFKCRRHGEVYQYLMEATLDAESDNLASEHCFLPCCIDEAVLYEKRISVALSETPEVFEKRFPVYLGNNTLEYSISGSESSFVFTPMNRSCCVKSLEIYQIDENKGVQQLVEFETNGIALLDGVYLFTGENQPEVCFRPYTEGGKRIEIRFNIVSRDDELLDFISLSAIKPMGESRDLQNTSPRANWLKKYLVDNSVNVNAPTYCCNFYWDEGNGFNEEACRLVRMRKIKSKTYLASFQFPCEKRIRRLRWDPIEGIGCKVSIVDVLTDGEIKARIAGEPFDCTENKWCLYSFDGQIVFEGDFEQATFLDIVFEFEQLSWQEAFTGLQAIFASESEEQKIQRENALREQREAYEEQLSKERREFSERESTLTEQIEIQRENALREQREVYEEQLSKERREFSERESDMLQRWEEERIAFRQKEDELTKELDESRAKWSLIHKIKEKMDESGKTQ